MTGWTDPPGEPALIGKATYDFYIVKVSPSSADSFSSILLNVIYLLIIITVVLAVLLLAVEILVKVKKKIA